ncbi:MAG: hypothetical protein LBQ94_07120 [Treponema sp.]|nr:hypothetical protein [Treponema sp.]
MKKNFFGLGRILLILVFALAFSGCATLFDKMFGITEVETETSQMIKNAATDLLLSQNGRIMVATLRSGLERQFSGLVVNGGSSGDYTDFTYQGKQYRLKYTMDPEDRNVASITGRHLIAIMSCMERVGKNG